mmetsp:Transcript_90401/g.200791  ORF Transcript_90401/g.200791 Transcript_90401/m.200791 type:complete len:212 (+) Transcript_90401:269-904(+)
MRAKPSLAAMAAAEVPLPACCGNGTTTSSRIGASGSPMLRSGNSRALSAEAMPRHFKRSATAVKEVSTAPTAMATNGTRESSKGKGATWLSWGGGGECTTLTRSGWGTCSAWRGPKRPCRKARRLTVDRRRPFDDPSKGEPACMTVMDPGRATLTVCWQRPSAQAISDFVRFTASPSLLRTVSLRISCVSLCMRPSLPGNQDELLTKELDE